MIRQLVKCMLIIGGAFLGVESQAAEVVGLATTHDNGRWQQAIVLSDGSTITSRYEWPSYILMPWEQGPNLFEFAGVGHGGRVVQVAGRTAMTSSGSVFVFHSAWPGHDWRFFENTPARA